MKIKGSAYVSIGIMAVMLAVIISSLTMGSIKSKFLPIIIAGVVLILGAIVLYREVLSGDKPEAAGKGEEKMGEEGDVVGGYGYLMPCIWVLGYFLAIYFMGFILAIPLFIFSYMTSHDINWLKSVLFAIFTTALIYGIFELALEVKLYSGLLFG